MNATAVPRPIVAVGNATCHTGQAEARWRAAALVAGGLVSAAGHMLHPIDHSAAARATARFEVVHYLFISGALLLLAGLPLLRQRLGGDRPAVLCVGGLSIATMIIPALVALEAFASPHVDHATFERINDSAAMAGAIATVALVGGSLGCGVLGWRRRTGHRPLWAALAACSVLLLLIPGLPGADGYWIIASMGVMNLAFTAFGAQWANAWPDSPSIPR